VDAIDAAQAVGDGTPRKSLLSHLARGKIGRRTNSGLKAPMIAEIRRAVNVGR